MAFLRSFFPSLETGSKLLSIEVQRGSEKVAVQVERGTDGNRNQMSQSTEKIFLPPYYREYLDATDLNLYDRLFTANGVISGTDFAAFVRELNDGMAMLQAKIERAYELQCSQVLHTGIVQLKFGTNINFGRKAASLVGYNAAHDWDIATVDPAETLKNAAEFLRKTGKAQGGTFNVIMGSEALNALYNNPIYQKRADIRRMELSEARAPQRNAVGAALHGRISAGAWTFIIWTYPEYYEDAAGNMQPYVDEKTVIVLPENPKFVLGFAAVPQLLTTGGTNVTRGAYVFNDYVDEEKAAHKFDVKSAGVAIPVAVDQIYTIKVLN